MPAKIVDAAVKLNAIRATSSNAYQITVPLATMSNIADVGKAVMDAPATVQNEFYDAIINLIGLQMIHTVDFVNPLSDLKKGKMAYGMTIEDIFVEMAEGKTFVAGTRTGDSVPDQFAITKAKIKTAFYMVQLERQYTVTIHQQDIQRAFLSADPVGTLTATLMTSLRTGEEYDDYRMTVALMARQIEAATTDASTKWKGRINLLTDYNALFSKTLTAKTCLFDKDFLNYMSEQMNAWSSRLKYPREDLNVAGVKNTLPPERQHIMMLGDIDSKLRQYLLAWAYNADKLAIGSVREIDAWYSIGADNTTPPTALTIAPDAIEVKGDLGLAGKDPCVGVIYDPAMLKIYNKVNLTEQARNARGHYTNIWHTVGDIYAASPFNNFVAFFLK